MQFARAFQRGHPRCSDNSRVELAGASSKGRGKLGALTTRTTPPVKSLTKPPHFSSVPLRLGGGGLHKNPQKTEFSPFTPMCLGLPEVTAVGPAHKCVQKAQIKATQTQGQGWCLQGDFSRRQQLHLLQWELQFLPREGWRIHLRDSGEDALAASLVGFWLCTLSPYLGHHISFI